MSRDTTCFFTGHRDIPPERYADIYEATYNKIYRLYDDGYRVFICGGAVGFDTLAAKAVLELRERFADIKLQLCIPCRDQAKLFSPRQKEEYEYIKSQCNMYEVLSDRYTRGCMHTRNRRMADASSYCIAFCEKSVGGSAYTVQYAISQGVEVFFVK